MEYIYTKFNPQNSRVANAIAALSDDALINRYIKVKNNHAETFMGRIQNEVNKVDKEEYLINPFMYSIAGPNLNYVASQLLTKASKLSQLGYEFNLDMIIRDLDRLLDENSVEVDKINGTSKVQPVIRDIAYYFMNEVLANRVLNTLENSRNHKIY